MTNQFWYKHIDKRSEMEEIIDDNPEMITRIFDMMETRTKLRSCG